MYRRIFAFLVIISILIFPQVLFAFFMPKDVPPGVYYYYPVLKAIDKKIINPTTYFYPDKVLTRAKFADWLVRTINVEIVNPIAPSFSDVPKISWAYSSIETAKKFGLVSGTQFPDGTPTGKFEPNALVNRAQAAVMIMKAFVHIKEKRYSFPDLSSVSWAHDAINRAVTAGFFSGYPDNTFGPTKNIIRAEGITVLMKIKTQLDTRVISTSFAVPTSTPPSTTSSSTSISNSISIPNYTMAYLLERIDAVLSHHVAVNLKQVGPYVIFFAFDPGLNGPYRWYKLSLVDEAPRVETIFGSYLSDLFQAAISPDGKEFLMISTSGKITVMNTETLVKTELGTFVTNNGTNRYAYPVYTSDGRYIILFDKTSRDVVSDPINNGLLVVDKIAKNIQNGIFISGFSLSEQVLASQSFESGLNYIKYTFLDNNRVQFNNRILNLTTMGRE